MLISRDMRLIDAAKQKGFGTINKAAYYYDDYDFCLRELQDKPIRMLEIGVDDGGSLAAWKLYFPHAERIVGVDIDERCKKFTTDNVVVYIGDQSDASFLKELSQKEGPFDLIVDDGGHTMNQQQTSFEVLFPLLKEDGIYVIEDLHTSYWPEFRDRYQTTMNFLHDRIEDMHYWPAKHYRHYWSTLIRRIGRKFKKPIMPTNIYSEWIRRIFIGVSIAFIFKGKVERSYLIGDRF